MKHKILQKIFTFSIVLAMIVISFSPALAADDAPEAVHIGVDDSALEVGVWWENDYSGDCAWLGDLPATLPDALGMRDRLKATSFFFFPYPTPEWTPAKVWGDANSWERDWKKGSLGGLEQTQIDAVDLAYFAGHGSKSGIYVGTPHDCLASWSDAAYSWGDGDNDWIGLAACNVLDDPVDSLRNWARAMKGTRLLMGFKTVMSDVPFGLNVGWHIRWNKTMTYAWFKSVNELLPSSQVARVLAEHPNYYSDKWYNHDDDTVYDNTFHWWTHQSGTSVVQAASTLASEAALVSLVEETGMPILEIQTLPLAERGERFSMLASTFNLTNTTPITTTLSAAGALGYSAVNQVYVSSDGDLTMDEAFGNYQYADSDKMWNFEQALQAADAEGMQAIDADTAKQIADSFLAQNNLAGAGAAYQGTGSDILTAAEDPGRQEGISAANSQPLHLLQEETVQYNVIYTRKVTPTLSVSAAGVAQTATFDVGGPGSKQEVAVSSQAPVSASSVEEMAQGSVMGAVGLWPPLEQSAVSVAGVDVPLTTPVLPTSTIEILYQKIGEKVALDYVPNPFTERQISSYKPAYYQGPLGTSQAELIPVYLLTVEDTLQEGGVSQYQVNVPVGNTYMVPYADILQPAGAFVLPGTEITLEAADATKTLKELGVDDNLDFVLGTGDPDSYTYSWYKNEVSDVTLIGSGRTVQYDVGDLTAAQDDPPDPKKEQVRIILQVEDKNSPNEPKIGKDETILTIGELFMPYIKSK